MNIPTFDFLLQMQKPQDMANGESDVPSDAPTEIFQDGSTLDSGSLRESLDSFIRKLTERDLFSTESGVLDFSVTSLEGEQDAPTLAVPPAVDPYELAAARKSVQQYILKSTQTVTWDDVVGNDVAKTALLEAIEHPIVHGDLYKHYGFNMPKGVLLYGPPGSGKTMFGKAAANAMSRLHGKEVELLVINGPEIQSPWVGVTEKIIRDIFTYAALYHKNYGHQLVIFIDEADSILPTRAGGAQWMMSNVATFLTCMDGIQGSGAFVILASNRPEAIDEAILREGRCDRTIKVVRPDYSAAMSILSRQLKDTPVHGMTVDDIARTATDYLFYPLHTVKVIKSPETGLDHHFNLSNLVSGAMVVGLVDRARGIAMRRDLRASTVTGITAADFREAVDDLLKEKKGLNHEYAMLDFIQEVAIPFEDARRSAT